MSRALHALLVLAATSACAAGPRVEPAPPPRPREAPAAPKPRPQKVVLEPVMIEVVTTPTGETRSVITDARLLLDRGNEALAEGRFDDALAAYDQLLTDFPESRLGIAALYNAGLAFEEKGDLVSAAARYRAMLERAPAGSPDIQDALFRIAMLEARGRRYREVVSTMERLLQLELSPSARVEAHARMGHALVELRDYAAAEGVLRQALTTHAAIQGDEHLDTNHYLAMAHYYLAEIPHRQFSAIPLRMPEEQMARDLDQKSDLFLLAEKRFLEVVEIHDPYWATAAVYQIGDMYKEFWDHFMLVPVPDTLNADGKTLYIQKINENDQLRRLLEKSVLFHERNVAMSRNGNVWTAWTEASRQASLVVRGLIARQQDGEGLVPGQSFGREASARLDPMLGPTAEPTVDTYLPARIDL